MHTALPPQIARVQRAGLDCLQLACRHGQAVVALHGGQLLSWTPMGGRDVFWLSPRLKPLPAAIRGGVPVCWPWFARQGMPPDGMQHGPVRNLAWQLDEVQASEEEVRIRLLPPADAATAWAPGVALGQTLTLGATLAQTLHTRNLGEVPFTLTQALHSYFAVGDARQVSITGLQGLPYRDKLLGDSEHTQRQPFALGTACDRVYTQAGGAYTVVDPAWQRRIAIHTRGSRSVVVWNPGAEQAAAMADIGADAWPGFFCVEAANAGEDAVTLLPGAEHELTQTLSISPLAG